ncbi:tetratricopeptide repeat protein [Actinoplanes sp. NPDC026619]|uniref:ATP-binding protein n=1 Tax=Actinoplanes sp. NPDC026619 TaxID=3155798 RepID=UPI0033D53FB9
MALPPFAALPDPGQAGTLDDLAERLRALKVWAGDPSYETITGRINAAWAEAGRPRGELAGKSTVADCFRAGRRRVNADLVAAVVQALHPDPGYVSQWRQALQVVEGQARAATQVRVQDALPEELDSFTGRAAELGRLRVALGNGVPVVLSGMAGVGKTQLAVHAAGRFREEGLADRVLFVNLRGFHPDPAQPPAQPAAVLDGFLRLLGVPGHQVPHELDARTAAFRERLAGSRTLVVLDNAADEETVRPLLPATPGCPVLVTSRRTLAGLPDAAHLAVEVFTAAEAVSLLTRAATGVPVGADPAAATRIAERCGHLPLAVGLVAGHIRGATGWTLTDHADRLDQRHRQRRLDAGVQLALDLSYRRLDADRRRLLRLAAAHPGPDLDAYAAAALTGIDPDTAGAGLRDLGADHLLLRAAAGRYTFHDLVRAFAAERSRDEDPPAERRAALTRVFDLYLAGAAAAADIQHPGEAHRRPPVPAPGTPLPPMADPLAARAWLDAERPTLVAMAAHAATQGWPAHATRLSPILFRYLQGGGHSADALTVHGHAHRAARAAGDTGGAALALGSLGVTYRRLGHYDQAAELLQRAQALFRQIGDSDGEARALTNLGGVEERRGRLRPAADHYERALELSRRSGDRSAESAALSNLGFLESRLGDHERAAERQAQALALNRAAGDVIAAAGAQTNLGAANTRLGRHRLAARHLRQALSAYQRLGNRAGEACVLDELGTLHARLAQPALAADFHRRSLAIVTAIGQRDGEVWALNGLGEAAHLGGRPAEALAHHEAAHTLAADIGDLDQQARAHAGLGAAHRALDQRALARRHLRHAVTLYAELGVPEADRIRTDLAALDEDRSGAA